MAKAIDISLGSVQRIWRAHKLQPHRLRTFTRSRDPSFATKLTDIVGLYIDPPAHAVVLSIDEKSQIQALDRTQPGLPIKPGRCQTMTHDYKRHGTTTLFAALEVATGKITADACYPRHRHQEFLRFMKKVAAAHPGTDLHVVLDNYGTHKHPEVRKWLARPENQRITLHFTPTGCSWLNMVERFFRDLTENRLRLRRGAFRDVEELIIAIGDYVDQHNEKPKALHLDCKSRRHPGKGQTCQDRDEQSSICMTHYTREDN